MEKTEEVSEVPETVEDISPKGHTNYDLVDKEVAQYASEAIVEIDNETNKRLKKLINKRILLVMVVTYFMQSLDKGTMSFASIMGIVNDAHLHGTEVSCYRRSQVSIDWCLKQISTRGSRQSSILLYL